jgi:hypothetical protein
MDLFYQTLPPSIKRKRRVHFHAFMVDVHKRLHAAKIAMGYQGGDPIVPVARDLAREAYVLCFDEFQVSGMERTFVYCYSNLKLYAGDRHRGCYDPSAPLRVSAQLRCGLCHDLQVRHAFRLMCVLLPLIHTAQSPSR